MIWSETAGVTVKGRLPFFGGIRENISPYTIEENL